MRLQVGPQLRWRILLDAGTRSAAAQWMASVAAMQGLERADASGRVTADAAAANSSEGASSALRQVQLRLTAAVPEVSIALLPTRLRQGRRSRGGGAAAAEARASRQVYGIEEEAPLLKIALCGLQAEMKQRLSI